MLTSKQRAFLRSQANTLNPILHLGKGELDADIIKQADDALTARELIKARVLESCSMNSREAAVAVAEAAGAEVVQVIGRNFVIFRRNEKEPKIRLKQTNKREK